MPYLNRDRGDGRYIGSAVVDSAGVWVDLAYDDFNSSTAESIPDRAFIVDLFVQETSGEDPAYILLRAHGALADGTYTGALYVPAGAGRAFSCYLPDINSQGGIQTIAVSGTARVEAFWL